jgi:hypothetical protein
MSSSSNVEMSNEINSYFMVTFPHSNGYENLSKSQWDFLFVSIPIVYLKAKTVAKLNSTEMDFWRRSARISGKDKIRNNIIKQKMNVTRSLLDDINH